MRYMTGASIEAFKVLLRGDKLVVDVRAFTLDYFRDSIQLAFEVHELKILHLQHVGELDTDFPE